MRSTRSKNPAYNNISCIMRGGMMTDVSYGRPRSRFRFVASSTHSWKSINQSINQKNI